MFTNSSGKHGKRRGKQHKHHTDSRDSVLSVQLKSLTNKRLRYLPHSIEIPNGSHYKHLFRGYLD